MDYEQTTPTEDIAINNLRATFFEYLEASTFNDDDYVDYLTIDGCLDPIAFCIIRSLGSPKDYDEARELCDNDLIDAIGDILQPFFDADPESSRTGDVYAFPVWYYLTTEGI